MKISVVFLIALSLVLFHGSGTAAAENAKSVYAEILQGCILYSDDSLTMPVTVLPQTYFVTVIETRDDCLRVTYKNADGYVFPDSVSVVDFTPKTKFASAKLKLLNDGGTVNVRSRPDHTSDNVIARLSDGASLYYYGTVSGTIQNEVIGDGWFCVELENGYGYVYSMYAQAEPVKQNVIEAEPEPVVPDPLPESAAAGKGEYFFIAALCLPVIIFMYLLFKNDLGSAEKRR